MKQPLRLTVHALIRGKGRRLCQEPEAQKIITHKRDAHIEAHFLRTVFFFASCFHVGGVGGKGGRLVDRLSKLYFFYALNVRIL